MSMFRIQAGTNPRNKPSAAFIAVYTEAPVYEDYHEVPEDVRQTIIPLVMFLHRWDGKIGFMGGMVEEGESLAEAAAREAKEEAWFDVNIDDMQLVCSHETPRLVTNLFAVSVDLETFRDILYHQQQAQHFLAESCLFAAYFRNYPTKKKMAFDNFMEHNFAPTVKEEIACLVRFLGWEDKYGIQVSDELAGATR